MKKIIVVTGEMSEDKSLLVADLLDRRNTKRLEITDISTVSEAESGKYAWSRMETSNEGSGLKNSVFDRIVKDEFDYVVELIDKDTAEEFAEAFVNAPLDVTHLSVNS